MDADQFRRYGHELVDFIADYISNQAQTTKVINTELKYKDVAKLIPPTPPQDGESWDRIRKDIDTIIMPHITHWQSPNFFAFFPSNVSYPSILGDLLSSGLGQQGMMWITSPALTELEEVMLDWFAQMIDLPQHFLSTSGSGGGVIQSTASESVIVSILAAKYQTARRHKLDSQIDPTITPRIVIYASNQIHSSVKRACIIAGIPLSNYREIPADSTTNYALDPLKLQAAIEADLAAGLWPCAVISCVGTTGCGAVDPLVKISEVAKKYDLWHHCDAAYAGSAFVCPEERVSGLAELDSFNFNPHKWLLVNFDCSLLWVKDKKSLIESMMILPEYLRNKASESGATDFKDWHIPLGRRFRALKLWFVVRTYGVSGLQKHIRDHINYAKIVERLLNSDPRFEVVSRSLSLVLFRLSNDPAEKLSRVLFEKINKSGDFYLTHTVLGGRFVIRMAIGGFSTKVEHVEKCVEKLKSIADEILSNP